MTALLLVGDVHERQAELIAAGQKFDLIITSPPFLALRSYLPDDHPQKHLEIGSEATPAQYLDVLLALTAEWRQLLAPHGSLAIELGDTYAGSGGAGGDYNPDGLRDGQQRFDGSKHTADGKGQPKEAGPNPNDADASPLIGETTLPHPIPEFQGNTTRNQDGYRSFGGGKRNRNGSQAGNGWPLDKSLCGIPTLYTWSLAYGRNLLTGQESPAGQWRIRNLKPWIRTNPPVGALGDKERPATSYITVATLARDRWFDLDAVRTPATQDPATYTGNGYTKGSPQGVKGNEAMAGNPGGAPPLDWWHPIDALIDNELQQRAGKVLSSNPPGNEFSKQGTGRNDGGKTRMTEGGSSVGARGWHIRRRLETAGYLPPHPDALDISPRGYSGAHYAVWPPQLVRQLVDEMCPRRVCTTCGQPSRRIVVDKSAFARQPELAAHIKERREALGITSAEINEWFGYKEIAKNWERTDRHGAAIPNPNVWPELAEKLGLDRERFDDLVLGKRRWTESTTEYVHDDGSKRDGDRRSKWTTGEAATALANTAKGQKESGHITAQRKTLGWSDCGHNTWTPGRILDPFSGSGTTLATATGMARDAVGIDLDPRNAALTEARCGMFLTINWGGYQPTDELPPAEIVAAVSEDLL